MKYLLSMSGPKSKVLALSNKSGFSKLGVALLFFQVFSFFLIGIEAQAAVTVKLTVTELQPSHYDCFNRFQYVRVYPATKGFPQYMECKGTFTLTQSDISFDEKTKTYQLTLPTNPARILTLPEQKQVSSIRVASTFRFSNKFKLALKLPPSANIQVDFEAMLDSTEANRLQSPREMHALDGVEESIVFDDNFKTQLARTTLSHGGDIQKSLSQYRLREFYDEIFTWIYDKMDQLKNESN